MTKQEKIQEAYGVEYENDKIFIDEHGWNQKRLFDNRELDYSKYEYDVVGHGIYIQRPKSLKGIENNNGWFNIESESDLPKERMFLECISKVNKSHATHHFIPIYDEKYMLRNFSHYKPMPFTPPIF